MKKLFLLSVIIFIFGVSYAGTVTLTGTCTKALSQNNIVFSLSNSGNDTAYNIHVIPTIYYAQTNSSYYVSPSIGPNDAFVTNVLLQNITANGTYIDYMTVAYQQGGSVFSALFPCSASFNTQTSSQVLLSKNITYLNGIYYINVTAFNAGKIGITPNISIILPEGFSYLNQNYNKTYIPGLSHQNYIFKVKNNVGGSYSGAVAAQYTDNGLNYGTFLSFVLGQEAITQKIPGGINFFYIGIIAVILILIALIIRAAVKKKANNKKELIEK